MVRSRFLSIAGATAIALTISGHGVRAGAGDVPDGVSRSAYFIELSGSVDTFRASAKAAGIDYTERYVYKRVWKGLSVQTSADAATLIGKLQGVKAVFPVIAMSRPPVEAASPELVHALAMTGADLAQASGLSGAGVKVGVIDTGIDYDHPDLGAGFGPGHRVAFGYDFVGDRYDAAQSGGDNLIPHPDNDPDDCAGHGTHVAGIIGASGDPDEGGARGVAPGVTFGAYRVFGCVGSTDSDIMVAAMDRALEDGMNVVNMSIGAAFQTWPQYPTAVAADNLVAQGVVVVVSIGNSGANGVYSASAPGVGRNVIGVGSYDNSHVEMPYFTATPDDRKFGYLAATGAPAAPTSGDFLLAVTGTTTAQREACAALPAGSLTGKVALVRRGTCGFYVKTINVQNAGAVAVIIANNTGGFLNATVAPVPADAPPVAIPAVTILQSDGGLLETRIAAGPTTMTWTNQQASFVNPTGGLISSFSSYGLTAELGIKPNIGAPGGLIRSTWPLEAGGYATISGTSMASPHVAGAAALFLEAHAGSTPAAVKTALQNSADPTLWSGNPAFGLNDYAHRQGAGMVDVDDAITATTAVTPSEFSLGEGTTAKTVTLTITNNGAAPVSYTFSHVPTVASGGTFTVNTFGSFATVGFASPGVTVPGSSSATVDVTITPPAGALRVYGGHLGVTGGGRTYRVPYAGIVGDYQTITVLAPGGCTLVPFPAVFKLGGETICNSATPPAKLDIAVTPQADGATYNVEDSNDRPVLIYHRAHQSRRLEIRALDVATNQTYLVASAEYVGRNAANGTSFALGGYSAYTWDGKRVFTNAAGKVQRKELPDGAYKLQVVVEKALAEPGNPAHIETKTTNTINIVRIP